jgi:integrase
MFTGVLTLSLIILYGEVLGLTWDCVDFNNKTILVSKQLQRQQIKAQKQGRTNQKGDTQSRHQDKQPRTELNLVPLKNDRQRRITPPDTVFALLEKQKEEQEDNRLKAGKLWVETGLVFTNDIGSPLDGDTVYQVYKRFLSDNGLSDIRLHDLRHTAATLMLQNGIGIKTVQETLGHHSSAFTLDVYGHVTDKMNRDSADKMEVFIKGVQGEPKNP